MQKNVDGAKKTASDAAFAIEIEINDFPQRARWKVTSKENISNISELSGAAITTRGSFFPPGKVPGPKERKLHLVIIIFLSISLCLFCLFCSLLREIVNFLLTEQRGKSSVYCERLQRWHWRPRLLALLDAI
jgi:hypothetical protein